MECEERYPMHPDSARNGCYGARSDDHGRRSSFLATPKRKESRFSSEIREDKAGLTLIPQNSTV
jgi:hypothetical protein